MSPKALSDKGKPRRIKRTTAVRPPPVALRLCSARPFRARSPTGCLWVPRPLLICPSQGQHFGSSVSFCVSSCCPEPPLTPLHVSASANALLRVSSPVLGLSCSEFALSLSLSLLLLLPFDSLSSHLCGSAHPLLVSTRVQTQSTPRAQGTQSWKGPLVDTQSRGSPTNPFILSRLAELRGPWQATLTALPKGQPGERKGSPECPRGPL